MKTFIKNLYQMNRRNIKVLIAFEALYKLLLGFILIPLATYLFRATMWITGYHYLTAENFSLFLKNPITVLLLFLIMLFLTILTLFDISTIIVIFDMSHRTKKVSLKSAVRTSLDKCKNLIKIKNIPVAFMVLFLIPFLNIGIGSNVISTISLPEFVIKYIQNNTLLTVVYALLYLILVDIMMEWIYSLHYMILENKSFVEACKLSKRLIDDYLLEDTIKIIVIQAIFAVIYFLILSMGILLIILIGKIFAKLKIIASFLLTAVVLFTELLLLVSTIISNGVSYSMISATFYQHKRDKKEKVYHVEITSNSQEQNIQFKKIGIALITFAFIGGCVQMYLMITGKTNLNIESMKMVEVTAHRGASKDYPENTMAAFIGAKDLGADWIELDVHQTKDGELVISHDDTLSRIAGIDKAIADMTYDEIKEIEIGRLLNKDFSGEHIPRLKDVLDFAVINNVRLNIELKPIGKEVDFEKNVIDLIKAYHFEERCVVTSQVYHVLETIKQIDPSIKTVYVTSIAYGNITDLTYADAFSVESINATKKLVKKVHNDGKEIYVWTVNSEENIKKMIELKVDSIITDDVTTCRKLILEDRNSSYITKIIQIVQ